MLTAFSDFLSILRVAGNHLHNLLLSVVIVFFIYYMIFWVQQALFCLFYRELCKSVRAASSADSRPLAGKQEGHGYKSTLSSSRYWSDRTH